MTKKSNGKIMETIFFASVGAVFGWTLFEGIKGIFPFLENISPIWKTVIGLVGIFFLTKFGLRRK